MCVLISNEYTGLIIADCTRKSNRISPYDLELCRMDSMFSIFKISAAFKAEISEYLRI